MMEANEMKVFRKMTIKIEQEDKKSENPAVTDLLSAGKEEEDATNM